MPKMKKVVFPQVTLRQAKLDQDGQPILTEEGPPCLTCGHQRGRPIFETVNAKDMMALALATPNGQGWSAADLVRSLPISALITSAKEGSVLLDEAQHQTLLEAIEPLRWGWYHGDCLLVVEAVRQAEEIEVEEVKAVESAH